MSRKKGAALTDSGRTDRTGKRPVAAHLDAAIARRIKVLAAVRATTVQALMSEAPELLFKVHANGLAQLDAPAPKLRANAKRPNITA